MGFFIKPFPRSLAQNTPQVDTLDQRDGAVSDEEHNTPAHQYDEKTGFSSASVSSPNDSTEAVDKIDPNAEHGVQAIQGTTLVWSKRDLILAYVKWVIIGDYMINKTDSFQHVVDRIHVGFLLRLCLHPYYIRHQ